MAELKDYDYIFKVPIVGDSEVGKTAILLRFAENVFQDSPSTTLDEDFKARKLVVDGQNVKLQIWDTAGQERFRTVTSSFYRAAKGIFLVFDITNLESFNQATHWKADIKRNTSESTPLYLIGNKQDLDAQRVVQAETARKFAESEGMKYFETSAKTGFGVEEAFMELCRDMIGGKPTTQSNPQRPPVKRVQRRGCIII